MSGKSASSLIVDKELETQPVEDDKGNEDEEQLRQQQTIVAKNGHRETLCGVCVCA